MEQAAVAAGGGGARVAPPRLVRQQAVGVEAPAPPKRAVRWTCPDCGIEVSPTKGTMLVKGNHIGACAGSGARKPALAVSD